MSPRSPLVSVLLPVRDGARWLPDALDSLEAQTLADHEVVVVDDGSADGTPEMLAERAARDPRIRVIPQEPAGIVAALERARAEGRGRYLARMDADDVAHSRRLEAQLELMEGDGSLAACGCRVRYVPPDAVRAGARRYARWLNASVTPDAIERELFVECPLAHPTFFMRAEAVAAVGGYRDAGWPEDYDLILRLWAAEGRFGKVPEILLDWRERPDRLSRTDPRYSAEAFRACKVAHLGPALLGGRAGAVVWGAGPVGKAFARALAEAGRTVLAFAEVDARKIGQEIHRAPVLDTDDALAVHGALHLGAVGQPGGREEIRRVWREAGLVEMRDAVAVA